MLSQSDPRGKVIDGKGAKDMLAQSDLVTEAYHLDLRAFFLATSAVEPQLILEL